MSASYGRIPRNRSSTRQHCCAICAPHAQPSFRRSRKELARENLHTPIPLPRARPDASAFIPTAHPSPCIQTSPIPRAGSGNVGDVSFEPLSACAGHGRSRILDCWTSQQARERIATMERQANEAELAALSHAQPVSALSSSFLREPSYARSESSVHIPDLRASSLVQMWKEFEAGKAKELSYPCSEISTEDERSAVADESLSGWDSDQTAPSEPPSSSWASDSGNSYSGRVADTIRRLSPGIPPPSSTSSWSDDIDREQAFARQASVPEHSGPENVRFQAPSKRTSRFRRPQLVEDLFARIRQERQTELARMVDRRAVSGFPYRRRIQVLTKLRLLQRNVQAKGQHYPNLTAIGLDQLQNGSSILLSEESFNHRSQQDNLNALLRNNSSRYISLPFVNSSPDSQCSASTVETESETQRFQEADERHEEALHSLILLPVASEGMQEEASLCSDLSLQDRGLEIENLNWPEAANIARSFPRWGTDAVMAVLNENRQSSVGRSMDDFCQGGLWDNSRRQTSAWLDDFGDDGEIHELLQRRRVTITLASDFRERMNSLILSFLHRQVDQATDDGNSVAEEERASLVRLKNQTAGITNPVSSTSFKLPLRTYSYHHRDSWRIPSFPYYPSHSPEIEFMCDLKGEMAQLHQEMRDLRKSIESCTQMQVELQHSIEQKFFNSTGHLGGGSYGETLQSSSQVPPKKGRCCICYEMQVDSLLYMCGHMCTCFKCAQELKSSIRKCPFCRAQIIDVVRAYSDP